MYPRLMILNGPDVSSVGAIVVGAIVVIGVQDWRPLPSRRGPAWDPFRCGERKDRRKAVLQSNVPGQNSFGIKLCPARSNCKLTIPCCRQCPRRSARLFREKSDDCAVID
jgi:hypothetical protein